MRKSGYLAEQARKQQEWVSKSERVTQQLMVDTLQVAIHKKFGFGYDRIKELTDEWSELYNYFHDALVIKNVEADVLREHLDRELVDIMKGKQELIPFEIRYPEIKEIRYEPKRK